MRHPCSQNIDNDHIVVADSGDRYQIVTPSDSEYSRDLSIHNTINWNEVNYIYLSG